MFAKTVDRSRGLRFPGHWVRDGHDTTTTYTYRRVKHATGLYQQRDCNKALDTVRNSLKNYFKSDIIFSFSKKKKTWRNSLSELFIN